MYVSVANTTFTVLKVSHNIIIVTIFSCSISMFLHTHHNINPLLKPLMVMMMMVGCDDDVYDCNDNDAMMVMIIIIMF